MPLELATAELGNRLRRAFGIRGRIDTAVDALASPSVKVWDATIPPFRSEGIEFNGSLYQAAVAGQFASIDVVADVSSIRAVVEQVVIANVSAAPLSFIAFIQGRTFLAGDCTTTEQATGTIQGPNVPIDLQATLSAASYGATSPRLFSVTLSAQSSIVIPVQIALTATGTNNRGLCVQTGIVNAELAVSYRGRFWLAE